MDLKRKRDTTDQGSVQGYKLLGLLGTGTYGSVFGVQEQTSHKRFAIKVLRRIKDHFDSYETQDMIREIFGSFTYGSSFAYAQGPEQRVMHIGPWLGPDLESISVLDYSLESLLQHLKPIVDHMSMSPFMHRDIKPANIVLPANGSSGATLIDFSLCTAKRVSTDFSVVTCWFRAPEIFMKLPYDAKIDVWSFGLTLFYCITGSMLARSILEDTSEGNQLFLIDLFDHLGWPTDWPSAVEFCKQRNIPMKRQEGYLDLTSVIRKTRPEVPKDLAESLGKLLTSMLQVNPSKRASWFDVAGHAVWSKCEGPTTSQTFPMVRAKSVSALQEQSLQWALQDPLGLLVYKNLQVSLPDIYFGHSDMYSLRILLQKCKSLQFSETTAWYAYLILKKVKTENPDFSKDYLIPSALFLAACFHEDIRIRDMLWSSWASLFQVPWSKCESYVFDALRCLRGSWPSFAWDLFMKSVEDQVYEHEMLHLLEHRSLWPVMAYTWPKHPAKDILVSFDSLLYSV